MELIRGLHNIRRQHRHCVLTIGNFDGVHLGHQAVLRRVCERATELGVPATAMIFEPQPRELFQPDQAPARLTRWRDKYHYMADCGLDRLLLVQFNKRFASYSASDFIDDILVRKLGVQQLVVGDDFRFGKGRAGDFQLLQQAGEREGFAVTDTASYRTENVRVSSTAIRKALRAGEFELAQRMSGRPFVISGKVEYGAAKGRELGFPTANIPMHRLHAPLQGVYVVATEVAGQRYFGMANVGKKPTVAGQRELLEVHLFDFNGNLYGRRLTVEPLHWLRDEVKFHSLAELKEQLARDQAAARQWLSQR